MSRMTRVRGESPFRSRRMGREARTIEAMVEIYCRAHHGAGAVPVPCRECRELVAYARHRLGRCPFREEKPTCARCPVHCYRPAMRDRIREVMRFAGPRMLRRHPILAVLHLLDGRVRVLKRGAVPADKTSSYSAHDREGPCEEEP